MIKSTEIKLALPTITAELAEVLATAVNQQFELSAISHSFSGKEDFQAIIEGLENSIQFHTENRTYMQNGETGFSASYCWSSKQSCAFSGGRVIIDSEGNEWTTDEDCMGREFDCIIETPFEVRKANMINSLKEWEAERLAKQAEKARLEALVKPSYQTGSASIGELIAL